MTDALVRLLVLLAIFGSIFLLSQMVLGSAWQNRARVAAVNRRLRLIREGRDRAEVVANLRKNAPREFNQFPEIIAGWLRSIQRSLFMAAVPYNVSQTLAAMGLGVAVVFVALVAGVWYSSIPLGPGVILLLLALAAAIGIALPILVISKSR